MALAGLTLALGWRRGLAAALFGLGAVLSLVTGLVVYAVATPDDPPVREDRRRSSRTQAAAIPLPRWLTTGRPARSPMEAERVRADDPDPAGDDGGDPACWLRRVCPACGQLATRTRPRSAPLAARNYHG